MQFEDIIRKTIEERCEDYFLGIADLSLAEKTVTQQYGSLFDEYPRAISIGITLPYIIQDELSKMDEKDAVYDGSNQQLDAITEHLSNLLRHEGYKTLVVPKIEMNEGLFMYLHKLAADLAGLGSIENDLLLTSEAVPGVNWGTVLTDAPLEAK